MKSYTMGLVPEKTIRASLPESYAFELNASDYNLFATLVNIGIDSRLQAIFIKDSEIKLNRGKACFELNRDSMVCLLNRLFDYSDLGSMWECRVLGIDQSERALSLRGSIMYTLGIEEV